MVCCRHWSRRPWRGAWPLGLSEHLGYDKGEPTTQARGNARNGTTSKTVDSEVGPFEIEVPRDRAGTFTPRLVRKGQRRLDGLDTMIISLYAGGMTVRDIQHHLASTLSAGAQRGDHFEDHRRGSRGCPGVAAPPAGGVLFPVVYHRRDPGRWSALITGSPPARLTSRSGRGMDGCQARDLSIWAPGPRREPPSRAARARRAGQQGRQGRADRRRGHLPLESEARGGM